jgi:hypothetical protein
MVALVTELVTVIGSVGITKQRNEAKRLSSDGSPGYPGSIQRKGISHKIRF